MWCPYITTKNNCRKITVVIRIFGGLNVLMPPMWHLHFEYFESMYYEKIILSFNYVTYKIELLDKGYGINFMK
jgi:hypothetical protein